MDRSALFIDAGYVMAAGGLLCLNTKQRRILGCDHQDLIQHLSDVAEKRSGLPILRTYWYDAAWGAVPTFEQELLAELPSVKLRLGRLGKAGRTTVQKGVDTILVTDLMVLAQERAVSAAFLMTGDEDIRPGVVACQTLGVRVTLMGIDGRNPYEFTQASTLVSESDAHITFGQEELTPFFCRRVALPARIDSQDIAAAAGSEPTDTALGQSFGEIWSVNLTPYEARLLQSRRVRIPRPVDAMLISSCRAIDSEATNQHLREGFWLGVDKIHPSENESS